MRTLIFILTLMFSTYAQTPPIEPGVSHDLAKWRAARYSDVGYALSLRLEKMSPVLKGTMEIGLKVRDARKEGRGDAGMPIILDWRKIRGHEDKSTISNVSINGRVLSPAFTRPPAIVPSAASNSVTPPAGGTQNEYEESNEHLIFRDGVVAGENVIKLDFTSPILPTGSAITRYVDKEDGAEYIYSLFVPSDASTAFPVFDQPDLKARFTLRVATDQSWKVVSNAEMTFLDKRSCQGRIPCLATSGFSETKPISTYVFAFAAGPWQQVSEPGAVATGSPVETKATERKPDKSTGIDKTTASEPRATALLSQSAKNPVATAPGSDFRYSIFVRKSQLTKFKPHAAEVFRLNREGVRFLEQYFDYKFPFPKYDIVLIPEFPFGGMEHAGATFLREDRVIFPQEPTKNDHITRANVIFHEAAHQWFGDTVTMKWFDDLWLKEGFAEFMAYKTLEKVMPEYNAWKTFYERNKQAAYLTDSTKGTTPIYQEIKNLSAAKSAYGNIVYRKAPSFLKQAEFLIGPERFQTAVRAFLRKHEFRNAGWQDLVKEFESASALDLESWAQVWVRERGLPLYRLELHDPSANPLLSFYLITQDDPLANRRKIEEKWRNGFKIREEFADGDAQVRIYEPGLLGIPSNVLAFSVNNLQTEPITGKVERQHKPLNYVFPNYEDYGYGIFLLDAKSRDYILKNIQNEKDEFLRSMMWGSLWDSVREGELDPKEYVELVLRVQSASLSSSQKRDESRTLNEEDETTTATLLNRVSTAMTYYIPETPDLNARLENLLIEKMRNAPTLGQRITFYRAFLNIASTENARGVQKKMLQQESEPGAVAVATGSPLTSADTRNAKCGIKSKIQNPKSQGLLNLKFQISDLKLKTKDRFDIVTRLLILNDPDAPALLAELEKTETSDEAKRYAYAARAGIPTAANKAKYWADFTTNKEISESWIEAAFGPFNSVRHADLTLPFLERALKELPNHKRNRKIFFVNGWLGAFIGGQRSEEALAIVNKFLADNPDLDRDLRLKILENVDVIERAVKIRGKYQP